MSISAMKQALEALEWNYGTDLENIENCTAWLDKLNATIPALRQAIAEAEKQEPALWFIQYEYRHEFLWREPTSYERNSALEIKPLYAAPREWVGLDDDIPGLGLVTEEFYNGMLCAEDILRKRNT